MILSMNDNVNEFERRIDGPTISSAEDLLIDKKID